jgi:thymidine kinase
LREALNENAQVIGIDEVQFFGNDIILVIHDLINRGKRVIVAGLDLDFRGIPFGPMPYLLALGDDIVKLKAVCVKSGRDAHFTQRLVNGKPAGHSDPIILVGAQECYEARSRDCHEIDRVPLEEFVRTRTMLSI